MEAKREPIHHIATHQKISTLKQSLSKLEFVSQDHMLMTARDN